MGKNEDVIKGKLLEISRTLNERDSVLLLHVHEETITELMSANTVDHINTFIARLEILKNRVIREMESNMVRQEIIQEKKDVRRGVS